MTTTGCKEAHSISTEYEKSTQKQLTRVPPCSREAQRSSLRCLRTLRKAPQNPQWQQRSIFFLRRDMHKSINPMSDFLHWNKKINLYQAKNINRISIKRRYTIYLRKFKNFKFQTIGSLCQKNESQKIKRRKIEIKVAHTGPS